MMTQIRYRLAMRYWLPGTIAAILIVVVIFLMAEPEAQFGLPFLLR